MSNNKKIYTFVKNKTEEVEEEVVTKNEAGEEVITKKKVKKEVPYSFFIKKPSRSLSDEASLYYAKEVAVGLKQGLMSAAMVSKRYTDDGGTLSEKDKVEVEELRKKLEKLQEESLALEKSKNKDKEKEQKKVNEQIEEIGDKLTNLISYEQSLFSNTAEYRARNKTVLYWIAFLSYQIDNEGNETPFFGDGSFNERVEKYDEIAEGDDDFLIDIVDKFTNLITVWANNSSITEKDFDEFIKILDKEKKEEKSDDE